MKRAFADTGYYLALLNARDQHHGAAAAAAREWTRFVLTDFVLVEVGNAVAASARRGTFPRLVRHLRQDPDTVVIPVSRELLAAGVDLYERRPDKDWSLTDCISFVVMDEEGLSDALTADHHFEQAGFRALLR